MKPAGLRRLPLVLSTATLKVRDTLFTPACVSCRRSGARWCQDCRTIVTYISPPWCDTCGYPMPNVSVARCWACLHLEHVSFLRSAMLYGLEVAPVIYAFKYNRDRTLLNELGPVLVNGWHDHMPPEMCVIPVPLWVTRQRERGFNQSALLGRYFARALNLPLATRALVRTRETVSQVGLNMAERKTNVVDAFAVSQPAQVAGHPVLLIDDVCTTGATLEACASVLRRAGATEVWAYTLARTAREP